MAARALWKGLVRFGKVEVPVKLYAAVEDRKLHFRLLGAETLTPVEQRMIDPESGQEVPSEAVRKGIPTGGGRFVLLDPDELEALEPEPSRDIEILRFIEAGAIEHPWYDRPYWLGPDGDEEAYFALAAALGQEEKEGIARWVMRKKTYQGALRLEGEHLMLVTLRHAGEVVPASALEAPGGRAPEAGELRMAEQLLDALSGDFEPETFRDEHRERVLEIVQAKAEGKTVQLSRARKRAARDEDLADVLEKSLAAARSEGKAA